MATSAATTPTSTSRTPPPTPATGGSPTLALGHEERSRCRRRWPVAHRQLQRGADEADPAAMAAPHQPSTSNPEHVIERPLAGTDGGDGERGGGEEHAVLPALARPEDEEPVLAVADHDGHQHQGDDARRGQRGEEPAAIPSPATTSVLAASTAFGRPGRTPMLSNHRAVPGSRPPPKNLLKPSRDRQTQRQSQDEEPEIDVVHGSGWHAGAGNPQVVGAFRW